MLFVRGHCLFNPRRWHLPCPGAVGRSHGADTRNRDGLGSSEGFCAEPAVQSGGCECSEFLPWPCKRNAPPRAADWRGTCQRSSHGWVGCCSIEMRSPASETISSQPQLKGWRWLQDQLGGCPSLSDPLNAPHMPLGGLGWSCASTKSPSHGRANS